MTLVTTIQKSALSNCTFVAGETPSGNDTWIFIPTVTVVYSDGTQAQQTFPQTVLVGNSSVYVDKSYPLVL
jgi:hypothetical protein